MKDDVQDQSHKIYENSKPANNAPAKEPLYSSHHWENELVAFLMGVSVYPRGL